MHLVSINALEERLDKQRRTTIGFVRALPVQQGQGTVASAAAVGTWTWNLVHPASNWTHWATLWRHSCLPRAATSASCGIAECGKDSLQGRSQKLVNLQIALSCSSCAVQWIKDCCRIFKITFLKNFYRAMHFSAKRGIAIACRLSVCLSVCP